MQERRLGQPARYDHIDLIECIAMLFVVMYHSTTVPYNFNHSAYESVNYFIRGVLSVCVPLFFLANGFLLINREFDLKKHLKKTGRLILLTFVWGAVNLLILMPIKNQWFSAGEFIDALWTWKQGWINHFWFMGALVCIYLLFPLMKTAYDHNRKVFYYWVAACVILTFGNSLICMVATMYIFFIEGERQYIASNYFNMFNPLRGLYAHTFAYFGIGCFIGGNAGKIKSQIERRNIAKPWLLIAVLCISSFCLGLWGVFASKMTGGVWDDVWNGYDSIFTCVNVLAIYLLSTRYQCGEKNKICRLVRSVSCNTFGVYVLHEIFIHLCNRWGIKSLPFMQNYASNFLYAAAVVLLCAGISLLLKKIPFVRKLLL